MGKWKGHYNEDTERARQEKNRVGQEFRSPTAIRLKEKLTGQSREEEIKAVYANLFKNHYIACYSGFAKRALVKHFYRKEVNG